MGVSPLVVVIGIVAMLSIAVLLILAFEERFDEKTAHEFQHDVAYRTMLMELRDVQSPEIQPRSRRARWTEVAPLYEGNHQGL